MSVSSEKYVLRGLLKIDSAIKNADTLLDDPEFKGKIARDIRKYIEFYVRHTSFTATNVAKTNWDLYSSLVYKSFDDIDFYVEASSERKKELSLFFAKVLSAVKDFRKATPDFETRLLVGPLISKFVPLGKDKRIRNIDINMSDFYTLVKCFDDISSELLA